MSKLLQNLINLDIENEEINIINSIKNTIDNVTDKTASDKFKEVLNNKAISQDPVIGALLRVIARTTNTNVVNVNLMMIEELSK